MQAIAFGVLLLLAAGNVAGVPSKNPGAASASRDAWLQLENAYQRGRATGDLSLLKVELERLFIKTEDFRVLGLNWIGRHLESLSHAEQEELYGVYLRLRPDDRTAASLRNTIAANRLEDAPREERAALYRTAVRDGSARVPGGDVMVRSVALGMAAADGLEEFRPLVIQFSPEINRAHARNGYQESDYLLILLAFRAGASDRVQANRLHAGRLLELSDDRFFERMNNEPAFREATNALASLACHAWQSGECQKLATLYVRQKEYQAKFQKTETLPSEEKAPPRTPDGDLVWMSHLSRDWRR
jgi:hypothetical protein